MRAARRGGLARPPRAGGEQRVLDRPVPPQLKAMFIVCRPLSLCAHSIGEATREKGWRASANGDMIQPLSLEIQGPDHYDGPADRHL